MVIHLGLGSDRVSIGGPFSSDTIVWVPFASYTDGWDTHAFRDGNRTVHSVSS